MNHKPVDTVTPDEIVDFIRKQNVSEDAATGIRLLRRAAETIDWLNHQVGNVLKEAAEGPSTEPSDIKFRDDADALDQISLALGLEDDSLTGVLDKIESLINDHDIHIAAIQQRDQVIQQAEDQLEHFNKLQPYVTLTPDQQAFQEALKFGYALVGYSYESGLPQWIVNGAKGIIEYSQQE